MECNDSDDDEEEELGSLSAKALAFITGASASPFGKEGSRYVGRTLSRPCWFAMGAMCIMLRMFGAQVCLELFSEASSLPKEAYRGLLQKPGP
jgi:hypothetical protein